MLAGCELIIDAYDCRPALIGSVVTVRAVCTILLDELQLRVVGVPQWHQFPAPGGVTGMYLLTESHLTCHTFPEHRLATFNLYCCHQRPEWAWSERLNQHLGAERVEIRRVERGHIFGIPDAEDTGSYTEKNLRASRRIHGGPP